MSTAALMLLEGRPLANHQPGRQMDGTSPSFPEKKKKKKKNQGSYRKTKGKIKEKKKKKKKKGN